VQIIKLGFLSLIILFLLVTGISLFIPSHVRISKAINLKVGRDSVMNQIKDASKWRNWYPGLDSQKPFFVKGVVKGVILSDRPLAYIVITKEDENEVIAQYITPKLNPVINGWKMISYSNTDSITLQWYMDFKLRWYPWEKFGSLVFESSYGSKMEKGLTNLKSLLEK
jgi:hypothetical protein